MSNLEKEEWHIQYWIGWWNHYVTQTELRTGQWVLMNFQEASSLGLQLQEQVRSQQLIWRIHNLRTGDIIPVAIL